MTRAPYVAVSGPADDLNAHRTNDLLQTSGWKMAHEQAGLSVWVRPERPARVSVQDGVVFVGLRLSEAATMGPPDDLAARAAWVCRSGWGAYVALLAEGRRWWVLRDPSGASDALTWLCGELRLVGSGLTHVPGALRPRRLSLNWDAIADFLRRPIAQVGRSALHELHAVAPGDLQPLGEAPEAAEAIWRPRLWLPTNAKVDPAWPERLRQTVQASVTGLVGPYTRVVTEVSGGLDSSIVNAAIQRAGLGDRVREVLNFVGDRPEADERRWAEALSERFGLPLTAIPLETGPFDPDVEFADVAREARPPFSALDGDRDRACAERLQQTGAQALVTGKGGDALFFQMPTAQVLADLWRAKGLAAMASPRNLEVARWLRRSIWSVLWEARSSSGETDPGPLATFAGPALYERAFGVAHPWLEDLEDAPRGKRRQIEALVGTQLALGPSRRAAVADIVQPLLAQPVMELCLSIPSWELVRGGRERGLAREAFGGWLPSAIVARRAKGLLSSLYARRVAQSAEALRAYLLDGVLVGARLLDRAPIERALSPDVLIASDAAVDLVAAAAVEAWVRHWQTRIPDAPHADRRPGWTSLESV